MAALSWMVLLFVMPRGEIYPRSLLTTLSADYRVWDSIADVLPPLNPKAVEAIERDQLPPETTSGRVVSPVDLDAATPPPVAEAAPSKPTDQPSATVDVTATSTSIPTLSPLASAVTIFPTVATPAPSLTTSTSVADVAVPATATPTAVVQPTAAPANPTAASVATAVPVPTQAPAATVAAPTATTAATTPATPQPTATQTRQVGASGTSATSVPVATQPLGTAAAAPVNPPVSQPTNAPAPSATLVPATATSTPTASATATNLPSATATATPTATNSPMASATATATPTATSSPTASATVAAVPTATNSPMANTTATNLPSATSSPTASATVTAVPTVTSSPITNATVTVTPTATNSPTASATIAAVPTASATATALPTASATATNALTPTSTPELSGGATATATDVPALTATASPIATTATPAESATVTATATTGIPTASSTATASITAHTPTATATASATATATSTPTATPLPNLNISGTIFEDVTYSGGSGRSLSASGGSGRPNVRIELYDATGSFLQDTLTNSTGAYTFINLPSGAYQVRVVNSSIISSRAPFGLSFGLIPVQTFRTDASSGTALPVTDYVGGADPHRIDAGSGSTTLAAITNSTMVPQSVAPVTLGTASATDVNFGFNFNLIVNTNDSGQGSLRQFITNANFLPSSDTAIFMLADGSARPGLNSSYANQFTGGVATIRPETELPMSIGSLVLDATNQPGWNNRPVIELDGSQAGAVNGLTLNGSNSIIRGLTINRFERHGILLFSEADNSTIQGTIIGLNANGSGSAKNYNSGIRIISASGVIIGGTIESTRNIISNNGEHGIYATGADGLIIEGNYIGLTFTGTDSMPNSLNGIQLINTDGARIGGTVADSKNVIANNAVFGISLIESQNTTIVGNIIGSDPSGTQAQGNMSDGVFILGGSDTIIGGTALDTSNLIAHNQGDGITILGGQEHAIRGNAIYNNTELGIDLNDDGVTNNDGLLLGSSNKEIDFPVFTSAVLSGSSLTISGYIGTAPGQMLFGNAQVEIFLSSGDASGHGEGQRRLGVLTAAPNSTFAGNLIVSGLQSGDRITATATDVGGNTSEFSANVLLP